MQVLEGRGHRVQELAFSHCGRWLAAAGPLGELHTWDTSDPAAPPRIAAIPGAPIRIGSLVFRSDGRLFLKNYRGRWFLYDPASGEVSRVGSVQSKWVVASPDGRHIVRVNDPGPLHLWRFEPGGGVGPAKTVQNLRRRIDTAAFAPDGATFATAERHTDIGQPDEALVGIREVKNGRRRRNLKGVFLDTQQMEFTKDGSHLVARSAASLACWNLSEPNKQPRKAVNPSRKHFLSMAVHPDGPLLTVDNDRLVRVWDVPALTTDRSITWNIGKLYAVAVSPDGTRAAVGSHTGKVLVWDWD